IRTGTRRQPAMQTRNTIFTMTIPFVIIPSQASESSGEAICKPCEVTIPASRQASTSSEFSETVISGSRNTQSRTRGDQHGFNAQIRFVKGDRGAKFLADGFEFNHTTAR